MKWLVIAGIAIVGLVAVVLVIGWALPMKHQASRRRTWSGKRSPVLTLFPRGGATSRRSTACPIARDGPSGSKKGARVA